MNTSKQMDWWAQLYKEDGTIFNSHLIKDKTERQAAKETMNEVDHLLRVYDWTLTPIIPGGMIIVDTETRLTSFTESGYIFISLFPQDEGPPLLIRIQVGDKVNVDVFDEFLGEATHKIEAEWPKPRTTWLDEV